MCGETYASSQMKHLRIFPPEEFLEAKSFVEIMDQDILANAGKLYELTGTLTT